MMEGWMISFGVSVAGLIAMFAVNRYMTAENARRIEGIGKKVDEHSEVISEHKIVVSNAVTMEQVDSKFLTRDLFKAHEKHIDQRFGALEKKLDNEFSEIKQMLKSDVR